MIATVGTGSIAPGTGTFRAIVWKELREGVKPGGVALAIVGLGLLFSTSISGSTRSVGMSAEASFPISFFTLTSAAAAFLIGRAQMVREYRGDMWALLTHRPVTRSTLFWGKVVAGGLLYLIAAGVPLVLSIAWRAAPGNYPAPFDARMVLPYVADMLCGLVYFCAALLCTMREARWYASRFMPLGAAITCSTLVVATPSFWAAMGVVVVGLVVVATAARGAFVAGGIYEPQSLRSRAALALSVGLGLEMTGGVALGIVSLFLVVRSPMARDFRTTKVAIVSDGTLARVTSSLRMLGGGLEVVHVTDLDGQPIDQGRDSTARRVGLMLGVASTADIPIDPDGHYREFDRNRGYRGTDDIFVPLVQMPPGPATASWYYMRRLGLIAGYDNETGRQVGWLGPDGFTPGRVAPAHRFEGSLRPYTEYMQPLIALPRAVYRLDLPNRGIQQVFSAPAGEEVLGAAGVGENRATPLSNPRSQFDAIATTGRVYVQAHDGTPQLSVARDPRATGYGTVSVTRALLAPDQPTFLWYKPDNGSLSGPALAAARDQITKLGDDNHIIAQFTVRSDSEPTRVVQPEWAQIVATGLVQPATQRSITAIRDRLRYGPPRRAHRLTGPTIAAWLASIIGSIVSALLGFIIGRRYAFDASRLWLWTTLGFVLGPLGVLLMLSLIDWPAREPCPSCGRERVVTRERCEHCAAAFNQPPVDGTEIFEGVETVGR